MHSSNDDESQSAPRLRILTVGDGDLTLSLALSRAYGREQIDLTASTLAPSLKELSSNYENTSEVVSELTQRRVAVWYGIDATQLHETLPADTLFDVILFYHPHLGYSLLKDEVLHVNRHFVLLAHYFASAKPCLKQPNGTVHVCLCGAQPQTWRVHEAANRQGLTCWSTATTTGPPHTSWLSSKNGDTLLCLEPVQPHYPAPRRYRNGKLGSKHYLGRYGYRHRRNNGNSPADTNVSGSVHLIFGPDSQEQATKHGPNQSDTENGFSCDVCGTTFDTLAQLVIHSHAPALPDPLEEAHIVDEDAADREASTDKVVEEHIEPIQPDIQTSKNIPSSTKRQKRDDNGFLQSSLVVEELHDGKRLRWYLRQPSTTNTRRSKKQCNDLIKLGGVMINGQVVLDSSRFLHAGDVISLQRTAPTKGEHDPVESTVETIRKLENGILVVNKPVGMRTVGNFSTQTLEMTVSNVAGVPYKSVSQLDTGCSGLCVLQERTEEPNVDVTHVFTALVHGITPKAWKVSPIGLRLGRARRWKNHRAEGGSAESLESDDNNKTDALRHADDPYDACDGDVLDTIRLQCIEQTTQKHVGLEFSTLKISTNSCSAGLCNAICYQLRKLGYPVVNDRLCRQEFMALPRSVRNPIKNKLCIGCFGVVVSTGGKKIPVSLDYPERLSALYWEKHQGRVEM